MTDKYVLITTISTFRHRYAVPLSAMQAVAKDSAIELTDAQAIEWAKDSVVMNEVREFSQSHVNEDIIDAVLLTQDETLKQFEADNSYLSSWSLEQKLNYIDNWEENHNA
jgi:hypothetical protein